MNRTHLDYLGSSLWRERLETDLLPWIDAVADLGDDVLEIGPGPGLTTDILRVRTDRVTAVEIDGDLAAALTARTEGTNVQVIHGDAAVVPLEADRFTAATCFSVLHHVPSVDEQERVLGAILRALRPGAALFAVDARDLDWLRDAHDDDTFVPLDVDELPERLRRIGFADVDVDPGEFEVRIIARKG